MPEQQAQHRTRDDEAPPYCLGTETSGPRPLGIVQQALEPIQHGGIGDEVNPPDQYFAGLERWQVRGGGPFTRSLLH
jgi:hypothetical protein